MASDTPATATIAAIRHQIEPSSPLSSAPPSPPPRKRSVTPTATNDNLPDTETTSKMSSLGLDGSSDPHPKKRTKLTAEEKAEREKEKEEKRKEKEEKEKEKARLKSEKEEQKKLKDEEKARKDAERAAEKIKKEEEKKAKDEERAAEKAKKEEEKKVKDEERAAEKARKEDEKARKEEEKNKKDKNQLRIASFFSKPGATQSNKLSFGPSTSSTAQSKQEASLLPSSISETAAVTRDVEMTDSSDVTSKPAKSEKSDYAKSFQPFFIRADVTVAPMHSFVKDAAASEHSHRQIDKYVLKRAPEDADAMDVDEVKFQLPDSVSGGYFEDAFTIPPAKRQKRGKLPRYSTKEILAGLNSSPGPVPDFYGSKKSDTPDYLAELKKLPRKVLKYAEDVRPPYRGTFSRIPKTSGLRKGRNPFQKTLPGINYDYDSEAEWIQEPDEDGEELMSEEDDDPADVGSADEMEDFLDDETEDTAKKRHMISGPLIPASSGLMWEDEHPKSEEWERFRLGVLIVGHDAPIDPFSSKYWEKPKKAGLLQPKPSGKAQDDKAQTNQPQSSSAANQVPSGQQTLPFSSGQANGSTSTKAAQDQKTLPWTMRQPPMAQWVTSTIAKKTIHAMENSGKSISGDDLADATFAGQVGMECDEQYTFFKEKHGVPAAIPASSLKDIVKFTVGSDYTKLGMLEVMKKQFPDRTKQHLKAFLDSFCRREGTGTDKRWNCEISVDTNGYWVRTPFT